MIVNCKNSFVVRRIPVFKNLYNVW